MKKSIKGLFVTLLIVIQANPIEINNLLTANSFHFNNISEALLSLASENLYVLNQNTSTGYA